MNDPTPAKTFRVIYHANCVDGFAAAWVARKAFEARCEPGDVLELTRGVYTEAPPDVTGEHVLLVDFSYSAEIVEAMLKVAASVTILDHHDTARKNLVHLLDKGLVGGRFDMEHSGAVMAWGWFFPGEPVPKLLLHIEDRDLWRFKLHGTREISAWLFSFPYDFEIWDALIESFEIEDDTRPLLEGGAILRKQMKDTQELVTLMLREVEIGGYKVPVVNLPYTMSSEAGHLMASSHPAPFAACYYDLPDQRCFGLRSGPLGAHVGDIAKQYGGGGHEHSAGFSVPRDHELARF